MPKHTKLSAATLLQRRRVNRYQQRLRFRRYRGKDPEQHPSYFVEGRWYHSSSIGGAPTDTRYMCIYVSLILVVFSFDYQGIERIYTAYHKDIKTGDWVLSTAQSTDD